MAKRLPRLIQEALGQLNDLMPDVSAQDGMHDALVLRRQPGLPMLFQGGAKIVKPGKFRTV
jgi:hypothetical protein